MAAILAALAGALGLQLAATPAASAGTVAQHPSRDASVGQADGLLPGPLTAPGGRFLRDSAGRVVFLHGVNAVYKLDPFELYDAPGKAWDFSSADARAIAGLGFDVVRLGIFWQGLEPGRMGPNNAAVCSPGPPQDPGQFDPTVADTYLARVAQTVDLLGQYGIYTILDMHQDLFSSVFGGDGAPPWAVCSNDLPVTRVPGRWSRNYGTPALNVAFAHFWSNDVVGDLQGQYDRMWSVVASYFSTSPWVAGYDPFNEPFSTSIVSVDGDALANQLGCFYTGRQNPPTDPDGHSTVPCPADDPLVGLIPSIEAADPHHLIFLEPDLFSTTDGPSMLGSIDFPNLVLNFHAYCPDRSPTGDPNDVPLCASHVDSAMAKQDRMRAASTSATQRDGPGLFMSEFGATNDAAFLSQVTANADHAMVGWTYWQWKDYDDPTGSSDEGLADPHGNLNGGAQALDQPYAEAVAGTPQDITFDPGPETLLLTYVPDHQIDAPTVIFVPVASHYPAGYCAAVTGGRVVSPSDSTHLRIQNAPGSTMVSVKVTPGPCTPR